jgi:hypothetical protein
MIQNTHIVQYIIHIQYPYIVGKYKIYLNELKKQVEKGTFDELFYSVSQRVQINFIFIDNVPILCLSCNIKNNCQIVRK